MSDFDWTLPAHLFGVPLPRGGAGDLRASLDQCVTAWLGYPCVHQQNCSLSWADAGGRQRTLEDRGISALVKRVGLPPAWLRARGLTTPPSAADVARIATIARYEPAPGPHPPAGDAAHLCEGYQRPTEK